MIRKLVRRGCSVPSGAWQSKASFLTGCLVACCLAGLGDMDDGDAIPAAPEDLMQMNEAQASWGALLVRGYVGNSLFAGGDGVKRVDPPCLP